MRALKEHDGHQEEITGKLKAGSPDGVTLIKEKRGDKTRVYVGVGESTSKPNGDPMTAPVLEVREFKHLSRTCGAL